MIEKSIFKDGANKNLTHPKNQKGITLIALVITIIVLLILTGVSISMIAGENGILQQSKKAKMDTDRAVIEERIQLAIESALIEGNGNISLDKLNSELSGLAGKEINITKFPATVTIGENEYVINEDGTTREKNDIEKLKASGEEMIDNKTLTDEKGHTITIPKKFKISSESPSLVTEGIIVEDNKDNQYVWIPIFTNEQYEWGVDYSAVTSKNDYENIRSALKSYTSTYTNSNVSDSWYEAKQTYYLDGEEVHYTNGNMSEEEYNKLYNNMLTSVYENAGFYIGRYEMGIAVVDNINQAKSYTRKSMNEYVSSGSTADSNTAPSLGSMTEPLSKRNAVPYTYITQIQAQMLAETLQDNDDYCKVKSSIMYGVQWDAVCVFIEKFDKNEQKLELKDEQAKWLKNSSYSKLWGNYSNASKKLDRGFYSSYYNVDSGTWTEKYTEVTEKILCTTGAMDKNSSLNIYDFGGNLAEMTLEAYSSKSAPNVCRGGDYLCYTGAAQRVMGSYWMLESSTHTNTVYEAGKHKSARCSLYVINE